QTIGPEACWLLTVIVHQEDVCRYRRPVTFWNGQLLPVCGFGSERRLIAARQKAIDAGFLHYDAGGKGKIAKYWVTIPPEFESLADSPIDEGPFLTDETQVKVKVQTQSKRSATVSHSNLHPKPLPEVSGAGTGTDVPKRKTHKYPDTFESFWEAYPKNAKGRKRGKEATFGYWKKIPAVDHQDLLMATENYAKEETQFVRDPERFLKQDWWRDLIDEAEATDTARRIV
ncbi:hypothetical protein N9L06_02505, partial [Mariniblastus sp.]|nr:hypothetical protein [Mariniblastus sp.]